MKDNIQKGTRIYYHGDMANNEGFGIVTDRKTDKWGTDIYIKLDDGENSLFTQAHSQMNIKVMD